jgi:hypothetical protein
MMRLMAANDLSSWAGAVCGHVTTSRIVRLQIDDRGW